MQPEAHCSLGRCKDSACRGTYCCPKFCLRDQHIIQLNPAIGGSNLRAKTEYRRVRTVVSKLTAREKTKIWKLAYLLLPSQRSPCSTPPVLQVSSRRIAAVLDQRVDDLWLRELVRQSGSGRHTMQLILVRGKEL